MTRPGLAIEFDLRDVVLVEDDEEQVIVKGNVADGAPFQVYVVADDSEVLALSLPAGMDLIARPSVPR
jgi:hypothetical protein